METKEALGIPRPLIWALGLLAAVALTVMVASVLLDSKASPTVVTPWGDISESSTRSSILP